MKSTPFDLKVLRHLVYTPTSPGCEVALGTMLVASIATTLKAPGATTAQTESQSEAVLPKSVVKTGGGFGLSPDFTRFSPRSVGLTNF